MNEKAANIRNKKKIKYNYNLLLIGKEVKLYGL